MLPPLLDLRRNELVIEMGAHGEEMSSARGAPHSAIPAACQDSSSAAVEIMRYGSMGENEAEENGSWKTA